MRKPAQTKKALQSFSTDWRAAPSLLDPFLCNHNAL